MLHDPARAAAEYEFNARYDDVRERFAATAEVEEYDPDHCPGCGAHVDDVCEHHDGHAPKMRAEYRDALRGLTYDNASKALVATEIAAQTDDSTTPADFVRVIKALRLPCRRCAGTGRFVTYVENGVAKGPGGRCFRCEGKGCQGHEDGHRNATHDRHYVPAGC